MTSIWNKGNYESSVTSTCFSGTPFCGSIGWEARWGQDGPALKDDQHIRRLLELERAIRPVPPWAESIARQIDEMPPCGWCFPQYVEALCRNIGATDPDAEHP